MSCWLYSQKENNLEVIFSAVLSWLNSKLSVMHNVYPFLFCDNNTEIKTISNNQKFKHARHSVRTHHWAPSPFLRFFCFIPLLSSMSFFSFFRTFLSFFIHILLIYTFISFLCRLPFLPYSFFSYIPIFPFLLFIFSSLIFLFFAFRLISLCLLQSSFKWQKSSVNFICNFV